MDDDEELKNQCFGGDYAGEVNIFLGYPIYLYFTMSRNKYSK